MGQENLGNSFRPVNYSGLSPLQIYKMLQINARELGK